MSAGGVGEPLAEPRRPRRRVGWRLGLVVAGLLLAVGHWATWYRPRPRPMAPADAMLAAAAPELTVRLWIPYPHQNLAALERAVERPEEVVEAAARLLGVPPPALPRLPLLGWPPASELLVAAGPGEVGVAAVRMYPLPGLLARLAGRLADNPWLAGGEVEAAGRSWRVSWQGRTWCLEAASGVGPGCVPGSRPLPLTGGAARQPQLAELALARPAPPLPAGTFRLRREGDDLVWRLGDPAAAPATVAAEPLVLALVRRRPARDEALLLVDREGGLLPGLPAAAAWARPGRAVALLPAGSWLAELVRARPEPLAGGELLATDRAAGGLARQLAPAWLPLAKGESRPPLRFGAWVATARAARRARQLQRALERVPLLGEAEARRWGDVATLLEAVQRYPQIGCWLAEDGSRGELRLGSLKARAR